MAEKQGNQPFTRSTRTHRTPPQRQNDSLVDPNASSCPLCEDKETEEMVQCGKCNNWYHFQCVGVDSTVAAVDWNCHDCTAKPVNFEQNSNRSSMSSRRRSVLQLEKLAKEKAIQDKLIKEKEKLAQQQAKVDAEFLQKEYDIRENMTDPEDDEFPEGQTEKTDYVTNWLTASNSTATETKQSQLQPTTSIKPLLQDLGATREQMRKAASDKIMSRQETPIDDLVLIPPLREQFAHPLAVENALDRRLAELSSIPNRLNYPSTDRWTGDQSPDVRESVYQDRVAPPPFIQDLIEEQMPDSARFVSNSQHQPQPPVPSSNQQQSTPFPSQQPIRTSITQSQLSTLAANQQQFDPSPYHEQQVPNLNLQRPLTPTLVLPQAPHTVSNVNLQQPTTPNPISTSAIQSLQFLSNTYQRPYVSIPNYQHQQPYVSMMNYQQQPYVPMSNYQQTVTSSMTSQQPLVSNFTQQQPFVPVSSYQPPIMSSATNQQQFVPNSAQQSMFGMNATFNVNGYGQQPQASTNQWNNYDPQLNSQQLPPSRLQLAARQTMPRDYPKFNGDSERWSIFLNAYVNCTTTCGLSNGENLSRLERCLENPARKAVKNLLTRPEAVPEIIETLKMLYGRPEASIDAQIRTIRDEQPPKMHKMETFIDFAMSVRNVTSEIQKSGMWQYLWNPQLMQELVDKLPYQMRLDWGQVKMSTPNVNLSNFSDWLFLRARTACAVTLTSNVEKKNSKSDNHVNAHSKDESGKKATNDNPKRSTNSNTKNCLVCNNKSHDTNECRKFLGMSLSDRWETVKGNKLCRICLGGHHVLRCDSKSLCGEAGCTVKHHRLLHNSLKTAPVETTDKSTTNLHSAHQQNKIVILRRYIPVTLHGPNGSLTVIAFLDEGSDMTLIENWVVQKLGITGELEDLFLRWTARIVRRERNSQSITVKISGTRTQNRQYEIKDARTVKSLNLPPQTINMDQLRSTYKFLRRIPIENYADETPKILIGLRDCKLITPLKTRSGNWEEPIATKTLLGWELHGANASPSQASLNFHTSDEPNSDDNLHRMIAQFFSLENFGVKVPEQTVEALSHKRARQLLETTTKRIGNKFETGLLWKYDDVSLPDSLPMAKRRLESLDKRLQKDPDLALKFRTKFHEYVEKGYVRKLNKDEEAETTKRTWYLPLFPVTYSKKPGKVRLVWDAAAKVFNTSLNSTLLSGPDLLVSLPGVLYRFRQGAFVVTGDIREMFHQVAIRKEDQTSQRFLWRENGSSKIDVYVLQVMSFGATCSPSSAQYVKNFNARQFAEKFPRAEAAIRENTYVDDWLQSFDTEFEAENVANEVRFVHSQGGFEIRNWLSNSVNVSRSLGTSSEDEQKLNFDLDESQTERILGMWWNVKQDAFTYSLRYNPLNKNILFDARRPTKREALRTLMSIYDPIGFLASYLVQLKMILQDIWRTRIGWDEQIKNKDDDDLYVRWLNWIKHLPEIEHISIKRHYSDKIKSTNQTKIELHVFVDAGDLAYATVAYFRIEDEDGVHCCLIGGKTKVAPLKPLSMPRMELQAAVLGARFKNCIVNNHTLKIERTVIWSDSSTVLSWLRSDLRRYTQYVGARVCEILETTELLEWRWVPSKMNPADDATKYKDSFSLDMSSRWFSGPDFLIQAEKYWPSTEADVEETQEELKPKYVHAHISVEIENLPIKFEEILQWKRTMAFVMRFINNLRAKLQKPGFTARYGTLTRKEFQEGENALFRKAQLDEFPNEIGELQEAKVDPKGRRLSVEKTSPIYRYSPYLDHAGVLRMRGRIDAAYNVSVDQKRPIILPTKHQITDMVVKDYHRRYKHQNTETVINEIKQRFMVPRLRALHKRIRRACQHCKNSSAQPRAPEMAQLPDGRLSSFTRVFSFVGVDYAGPYMINSFRRSVKRWIVIFTCLTVRAVYIDCVETLTTDSCIMAIRRFIARNGTPREFFSDNGTNFVGANNELTREVAKIDHELLNVTFTTCYTQWNFNPPSSQHMGGAWERLIRSMKTTLDKILPKSHYPNHETLVTALAEVENIINSRPLTFVSIEPDDHEALTPNHFLKGSSNGNKPPGIFPPLPKTLRGNWRYSQQIANEFWNKWVKEYLPMITRRTKWFDDVKPIEVGDQVIIVDEDAHRNTWDRGVVVEAVKTGRDDRVSRVKVRTTNGIYTRPVTKLAVLDLDGPEAKPLTRETLAGGSVTASSDE